MCEYWKMSCGHLRKKECEWRKIHRNQELRCQNQTGNWVTTMPKLSFVCPGSSAEPTTVTVPCYSCLHQETQKVISAEATEVEAMKHQRHGAGNDNWGFSSRGMVGYGEGGNSNWINQQKKGTATSMNFIRQDKTGIWPWNMNVHNYDHYNQNQNTLEARPFLPAECCPPAPPPQTTDSLSRGRYTSYNNPKLPQHKQVNTLGLEQRHRQTEPNALKSNMLQPSPSFGNQGGRITPGAERAKNQGNEGIKYESHRGNTDQSGSSNRRSRMTL